MIVHSSSRMGTAVSLLIAGCLVLSVLAGGGKHARGRLTGPVLVTPHDASHASLDAEVSGTFSHIGRVSSTFHTEVELDSNGNPIPIPPSTGTINVPGGGTLAFTFKWTSIEVAPNVFDVAGPFSTTGGDGLLAGVNWQGEYHARLDLNSRSVVIDGAGLLIR
jgi:hypothetical protein